MYRIVSLMIVGILVLSGLGAADILNDEPLISEKIEKITFSKHLAIQDKDGYLTVNLEGADSQLKEPGKPMLPVYHKTFTFSSTAKIKEVTCDYSETREKSISGKIIPAPELLPHNYPNAVSGKSLINEDEEIYGSEALFPGNWYDYSIRCGLNSKGVSTTFVTIEIYPVQYLPVKNVLYHVSNAEIQIIYDDPGIDNKVVTNAESYDMVIIAPEDFSELLQPLVNHKNDHGLNTFIKTTEGIYSEYTGRDKPEQIKYFIKDAKETLNITYVLLVGGLKSYIYANDKDDCNQGSTDWHVPVRYTNIKYSDEVGCISDLYYSDLYRYNESSEEWEFEDWDSNGNSIFAEYSFSNNDEIDCNPDVHIGRLACRNKAEVEIMVNKIINYEKSPPEDKPWFKKMIGIAGKTFYLTNGQPDGEFNCDMAFDYMGNLVDDPVRVYASNRDTGGLSPITADIITAISQGAGYVFFQGHGNPMSWNTIWHDGKYPEDWIGGLTIYQFGKLSNDEKLPVVVVGGCHNGLFNVTLIKTLLSNRLGDNLWYWTGGSPAPVCFSWGLCILPEGGAIASTGNTGYGSDPSDILELNFFYEIGQNGATTFGGAHSGAIRKYITEKSRLGLSDAFFITIHQVFGDPSLKLGGYS